jgi:hypothetical protein
MKRFISEDDLGTFEGWLEYQAVDAAALTQEQLTVWRDIYDLGRERAGSQGKIGRMKLPPLSAGEFRYAVALRDGADLWLTLWVRRSRRNEFFVMIPRGTEAWDPHTSYHLDGTLHAKSYGQKFPSTMKRQPLSGPFRGVVHLGSYAGHAPKTEGAICDAAAFSGIVEVPSGVLGPRHGAVTIDLVEPGHPPDDQLWAQVHKRETFRDAVPWVVITVGRPLGEDIGSGS